MYHTVDRESMIRLASPLFQRWLSPFQSWFLGILLRSGWKFARGFFRQKLFKIVRVTELKLGAHVASFPLAWRLVWHTHGLLTFSVHVQLRSCEATRSSQRERRIHTTHAIFSCICEVALNRYMSLLRQICEWLQ